MNLSAFFHDFITDLNKQEKKKVDRILKVIIGELLVKGVFLWILSVSFFPVFSHGTVRFLHILANRSHLLSNARFVTNLFVKIDEAPQRRFLIISIFLLIWGTTDLIEAVGIWQKRRWAEYMTVAGTVIFIPIEMYSIFTHFTAEKIFISLFNIFLVIYIIRSRKLFQFFHT